jgi:hypothetical protein
MRTLEGSLVLKRASASSPSGQWQDEDYDVLADGKVVGCIPEGGSRFDPPAGIDCRKNSSAYQLGHNVWVEAFGLERCNRDIKRLRRALAGGERIVEALSEHECPFVVYVVDHPDYEGRKCCAEPLHRATRI